jgi:hypothetical protein
MTGKSYQKFYSAIVIIFCSNEGKADAENPGLQRFYPSDIGDWVGFTGITPTKIQDVLDFLADILAYIPISSLLISIKVL